MKCNICKEREGILKFTDSMMSFTHGFTQMICRQCYIEIIEKELKKINANLIKQKKILRSELNQDGGKNGNKK